VSVCLAAYARAPQASGVGYGLSNCQAAWYPATVLPFHCLQEYSRTANSQALEALQVSLPSDGFSFPVLTPVPHAAAAPVADLASFRLDCEQLPASFRLTPLSHPVAVTPSTASTAVRGAFSDTPGGTLAAPSEAAATPVGVPSAASPVEQPSVGAAADLHTGAAPATGGVPLLMSGPEQPAALVTGHMVMTADEVSFKRQRHLFPPNAWDLVWHAASRAPRGRSRFTFTHLPCC